MTSDPLIDSSALVRNLEVLVGFESVILYVHMYTSMVFILYVYSVHIHMCV